MSHDRLKSAPAKVTRRQNRYTDHGRRLGRADRGGGGPDRRRALDAGDLDGPRRPDRSSRGFAWRFWTFDWGHPPRASTAITSRAFDVDGNVQPAPDDPFLASRRTYWESNGQITRRVLIP